MKGYGATLISQSHMVTVQELQVKEPHPTLETGREKLGGKQDSSYALVSQPGKWKDLAVSFTMQEFFK